MKPAEILSDDAPPPADRLPRTNLFLAAVLRSDRTSCPVRVRNLSPEGAMIEGAGPVAVGTNVELVRGPYSAVGIVRWNDERRLGLMFAQPIGLREWMAPIGATHQQQVDQKIAVARLPTPTAVPMVAPPPARPLAANPGDLGLALKLIEALSETLAEDRELLARFPRELQSLDLLHQLLSGLKAEAEGRGAALDSLRMAIRAALARPS